MGEASAAGGPDFAAGILASEVRESVPLLGHIGADGVILVRKGAELFALGASCTHYGGPLAQGLVVGDQVRCPLHHACFSLRTGEAVRAPALNPLPCWRVELKDGKAYVREKLVGPTPPAAGVTGPESVVIVGAGAAGNAAAEALRRAGYPKPVTLICAEEGSPVDRPNVSKDYLAGTAPEDWMHLRDEAFYRDNRITFLVGQVTRVDPAKKEVALADGRTVPYGALLLATGANPIRLTLPGADLPHVYTVRSLADGRRLGVAAKAAQSAVVIGASFIGLEVAASLRARNLPVQVVAPEERPLERILGLELSKFVQALHEGKGVRFHLGRKPASITAHEVTLDDGSRLSADLVVMGVGVRPATELAEQAGCKVEKGVLVDGRLETTVPGIFAAGDLARYPDSRGGGTVRIEHWVVAERMGQHAARSILGETKAFDEVPFFWSQHYDVTLGYAGHAEKWDDIRVSGSLEKRVCTFSYRLSGRVVAVVTLGRDLDNLRAEAAMERGDEAALGAL